MSLKAKIGYFAFGAAFTYFINFLRIAIIFTIGMQYGTTASQVEIFHFYYRPLYPSQGCGVSNGCFGKAFCLAKISLKNKSVKPQF